MTATSSVQAPVLASGLTTDHSMPVLSKLSELVDDLSSDSAGDDEQPLYIDQDDAQSIFQPALSPTAIRLTSPKTPAAEKAAAMEKLPGGGLFNSFEGPLNSRGTNTDNSTLPVAVTVPRKLAKSTPNRQARGLSLGQLPARDYQPPKFPSPWQSGPRELVIDGPISKPMLSTVLGSTKPHRSSSVGVEAFKRLREALPSITLPSGFFSGLTSPSFLSGVSSSMSSSPPSESRHLAHGQSAESKSRRVGSTATAATNKSRTLRRVASDESMLYHSLSRVSSLGDDDRWHNIHEQANVRFKAIRESIDRPSFKLPQLPNALKRHSILGIEASSTRELPLTSPSTPHLGSFPKDSHLSELDRALEALTGDIVVMGGYRGSILRSTKTNRQVWVPVKVGLNIRKVNLEVGLMPEDEERMEESIYASGMLQHIGPVDISRRLFKRLRECENAKTGKLRVWDYGWDWRLSPHILSRKLIAFLEQLPCNSNGSAEKGATVIAHSLGGIITRHAVNQRPELFAGVVFAGSPQRCINILGPLRNGDAVLLNEKVLTAQVNFSLRTSFVFLPEDGFCFINKHTGEEFPIDFYNPDEWEKYCLSPCMGTPLPPYKVRQGALGSFLNLSNNLPNLPMRSRGNSAPGEQRSAQSPTRNILADAVRQAEVHNDRSIAPQIGTLHGSNRPQQINEGYKTQLNYKEYLTRTLHETKVFRSELTHRPGLTESNSYPPFAVIYGKDIPTVYATHVSCREAIPCADVYDDLLFRSGDGVVLAREAMLPPGYDVVNGGRVSTDRGHITMLGDLSAVGKALEAVIKGRKKGIGLGPSAVVPAHSSTSDLDTPYE
ncbi:hypothetical protein BX600DRAFT_548685 [Xylariales sp. PMI_506]|nr:hypothetical protein BX600DRAFT_548685 [Xylariales sp. PMI_506]